MKMQLQCNNREQAMEERVTVVQTRTAVMEADDGAQMEVCRPGNIINVGFKGQGAVQDDTQAPYLG